jgi:hypothetical protein
MQLAGSRSTPGVVACTRGASFGNSAPRVIGLLVPRPPALLCLSFSQRRQCTAACERPGGSPASAHLSTHHHSRVVSSLGSVLLPSPPAHLQRLPYRRERDCDDLQRRCTLLVVCAVDPRLPIPQRSTVAFREGPSFAAPSHRLPRSPRRVRRPQHLQRLSLISHCSCDINFSASLRFQVRGSVFIRPAGCPTAWIWVGQFVGDQLAACTRLYRSMSASDIYADVSSAGKFRGRV